MRVVVLTTRQPNQVGLVAKLGQVCDVVGVVSSSNAPSRPSPRAVRPLVNRVAGRTVGRPLVGAWFDMLRRYEQQYPNGFTHNGPVVEVEDVNNPAAVDLLRSANADLAVVSGTNLVRAEILSAMADRSGVVNLHTGISPFVKGAPNCTNWCLTKQWFHYIGNTVMWLDPGIDSGPIIATERTPLDGKEDLAELHWKVMEHGQCLYVRSVGLLAQGRVVPRVRQDTLGTGATFYSRAWGTGAMLRARWNFARAYSEGVAAARNVEVPLVQLPS
jgi:methionyl-tRNA formyltransferase